MRLAAIALVLCACCTLCFTGCAGHPSKTSDATTAAEASTLKHECNPANCAMTKEECEKMKAECAGQKKACCGAKAAAAPQQ
jgi:hypothetical protein